MPLAGDLVKVGVGVAGCGDAPVVEVRIAKEGGSCKGKQPNRTMCDLTLILLVKLRHMSGHMITQPRILTTLRYKLHPRCTSRHHISF